jgi:hypothetical protein
LNVIFVPVLRHRLAVVDRLVVRLDIGVVAPVLEAAIAPREVGRMVALMRHLRRVYLGADLALRLVVSWASCSTGQKKPRPFAAEASWFLAEMRRRGLRTALV